MLSDLKFAFRQLAKSPGFTAVAVLSLALGIGANTTIFSLVNEVLLKSLPVRDADQLVLFSWAAPEGVNPKSINGWTQRDPVSNERTCTSFSLRTFERFRASGALADTFAFAPVDQLNVIIDGQAEMVRNGAAASGNYHAALGVPMAAGRGFTEADDAPSAPPVVVLSHAYWQRRFAGDPAAIGKSLTVNNVPVTVVGVTARQFNGTMQVGEVQDITFPLAGYVRFVPDDAESAEPWSWWVRIMGRLPPATSVEPVRDRLAGIFRESIKDTFGRQPKAGEAPLEEQMRLRTASGAQGLTEARRNYAQSLRILTAFAGLVLLVACANIANLLLARGAARQREIAVRLALGANRLRLLRQLLTESLLLGGLGGLAGLAFAWWGRSLLLALEPLGPSAPVLDLALDWRVLGFTIAAAMVTSVLFGLAPAWRATRLDLNAEFAGGARALGAGTRSPLARGLMVVQVALSLVLLVGAGLFARTLINLQHLDAGFDPTRLLLFRVNGLSAGHPRAGLEPLYARIADRVARLPGVKSVAYSRVPVLANSSWTTNMAVEGYNPAAKESPSLQMNGVNAAFFATYRLPLLHGRAFDERDTADARKVAIVNEAFARKYFPDESPVGRHLNIGGSDRYDPATAVEIVGVARDSRSRFLKEKPAPAAYVPHAQLKNAFWANFALRVEGEPQALASSLSAAVREIDPTLPVFDVRTQEDQIERLMSSERMFARLSAFFGLLALLLASVGLYGLLSYSVLRRTGEIGLRMALGAVPRHVLWMIVRESLLLASLGIVIGLGAAWGLSRLVASRLYGLSASDPVTYAGVGLLLVTVAVIASLLPARRAAAVDPMVALRTE